MKILLLNPPFVRCDSVTPDNDYEKIRKIFFKGYNYVPFYKKYIKSLNKKNKLRYGVRAGSRWPWTANYPIGALHYPFIMAYAASYLKKNGLEIKLIDAVAEEEYSFNRFLTAVKAENAGISIIETSTPTFDIDLWFAEKISNFSEVCLAGPHITDKNAKELLKKYAFVKYWLKGEYIKSSLTMAQTKRRGIYDSEIVKDLNLIPFPYRDYPAALKYYDPSMPTERPQLQIYGSKGCPFKCVYCMWPQTMYKGVVSYRSPESISEEIIECRNKYGVKSILFDDDTFNIGTKRIEKLCDMLKQIKLPWTMMGRLDCSPEWLYAKMVDSGCVGMRFGIETFDTGVLKRIKKGLVIDKVYETLKYITQEFPNLMIHLTMMKNLPGQTTEIHNNDMRILKLLGYSPDNMFRSYQLANCAPFPGTELYAELQKCFEDINSVGGNKFDGGTETIMSKYKDLI